MRDLPKTNVRPPVFLPSAALLARAAERRLTFLGDRVQDAWRVLNGPGDGAPLGLTLDRYADWLVLAAREHLGAPTIEAWARAAVEALAPRGLILQTLAPRAGGGTSRLFHGEPPPTPLPIREADAVLLVDLEHGLSTGLFLDQHDTRLLVRPLATGRTVLNLFAYTCAFSVHAALGGAARVTSVDVSKKALRWGRDNMMASGLDPDRHRWFPDDVLEHLGRAARRGDQYGLVILDPPVLGRAGGRTFSLEQSLERLLDGCVQVVEPGGVLLVSVHATSIDAARIRAGVDAGLQPRGLRASVLSEHGLPEWDHPASERPDALDRGHYLKTLVLRVS